MCINKEYSLSALILSWTIGAYLLYRNYGMDRWNAIFLITFSTMQLFDFILWILFETGNENTFNLNYIISKYLIPILLSLELLNVYIGSILYKNNNNFTGLYNKIINNISDFNTIYPKILIPVIILLTWYNIKLSEKTIIGSEGNLIWGNSPNQSGKWKYITGIIFIFFLIYPYLEYFFTKPLAAIIVIYCILTLGYSFLQGSGWGSYWCWISNVLGIIMLFGSK